MTKSRLNIGLRRREQVETIIQVRYRDSKWKKLPKNIRIHAKASTGNAEKYCKASITKSWVLCEV